GEIVFLHRVTPGSLGRSYGVHVAKMAGMPLSIVRRAEEVLKHLEAEKERLITQAVFAANGHAGASHGNGLLKVGDGNGHYTVENGHEAKNIVAQFIAPKKEYVWQSEEARLAAQSIEQADGMPPDLDAVDVCAITPLDALNLIFMLQKKRRSLT
ncbi:MAG TPA: hypothetical protein VJ761_22090, partial [Ktedonobacteraceae bacterium]|nr:hypothetical protein [Ktedonobacteraceae bacterium]